MADQNTGFGGGFEPDVLYKLENASGLNLLPAGINQPSISTGGNKPLTLNPSTNLSIKGSTLVVSGLGTNNDTYDPDLDASNAALTSVTDAGLLGAQGTSVGFLADGQGAGEMVRHGSYDSSVTSKGMLISFYQTLWYAADRSDSSGASAAHHWLGIAMDIDGGPDEGLVLLRGYARIDSSLMNNYSAVTDVGKPVYLSTTAGEYDLSVSSTTDDIVRVVGYLADTDGTDHLIYFCPDNTWVKIA